MSSWWRPKFLDFLTSSSFLGGGSSLPSLGAGTVSSNGVPTSTEIDLVATAAIGGVGSVTVQWRRATSSGGTYSDIFGKTSLTLNDTGLSEATDYYYKVRYTDGAGRTVDSAEYHATTWSPASLPNLTLFLWEKVGLCYTDVAHTTLCVATDPIAYVAPQYGTTISASQSTSGKRPTLQTGGLKCDGVDDNLSLSSDAQLTGDFTMYLTGSRVSSSVCDFFEGVGNVGSQGHVVVDSAGLRIGGASGDLITGAVNGMVGSFLLRVRRSGSTIYAAWTGQAEVTAGTLAEEIDLAVVGSWLAAGEDTDASNRLRLQIVTKANIVPGSSDDLNILAWIASNDGGLL